MKLKELGALFLLASMWGASFLFIRVAAPAFGPFLLVDLRVLIAGLALLIYAFLIKQRPDFRTKWKEYLILGGLNAAIPFTFIAAATLHLTASMAAILNATTPLFGAIIARIWLKESLTFKKLIGIPLGLIGVVILVGWNTVPLTGTVFLSVLFSLLGAATYGLGGAYANRTFKQETPLTLSIGQQLAAGILLIPFLFTNAAPGPFSSTVILNLLALAIICTAIGYLIYFYLIAHVGSTKTLTVTFLVPFFGVIWGAIFLHEAITWGTVLGLITILGSTFLITDVKWKHSKQMKRSKHQQ
ncbi:Threonine/homoserine efflux transporter RhtA [Seinonella peptonophila]|uniref:Threonine/homoserine efflux transporter RhtA n=1 Tax=Seinonella peptonophila TaxID=112248 RepID=A0A1M4Z3V9_9BACL|nr:EamA family transporter [Seinonella peptonophila]SHF12721.1 Threonine/homoserine efflux transporter RhtA [Seinonella peptonophila]